MSHAMTGPIDARPTGGRRSTLAGDVSGLVALLVGRFGRTALLLMAVAGMGVLLSRLTQATFEPGQMRSSVLAWLFPLTQIPLVAFAIFAMDWARVNSDQRASGCDVFLLRSPIATWLLAMVPMIAKGCLIAVGLIFMLAFFPAESRAVFWAYVFPVWLATWAIGVWICVAIWHPARRSWHRTAWMLTLLAAAFSQYFLLLATAEKDVPALFAWLAVMIGPLPWPVLLAAIAGVPMGIRAMSLARVHSSGLPLRSTLNQQAIEPTHVVDSRWDQSRSVTQTLRWFDRNRCGMMRWWFGGIGGSFFLFLLFCMPLNFMMFFFGGVTMAFLSMIGSLGDWADLTATRQPAGGRRTPDMLAVSPIPVRTLAAVKLRAVVIGCGAAGLLVVLTIFLSAFQTQNSAALSSWSAAMTMPGGDVDVTGRRLMVVAATLMVLTATGVSVASLWVQLLADRTVTMVVTAVFVILLSTPLFLFLAWILRQREWQDLIDMRDWILALVPMAIVVALVVKAISVGVAVSVARRSPDRSAGWLPLVAIGWVAIVGLMIAWTLAWLPGSFPATIPALAWWTRSASWVIVGVITLATPLATVLVLPWSMAGDVHR